MWVDTKHYLGLFQFCRALKLDLSTVRRVRLGKYDCKKFNLEVWKFLAEKKLLVARLTNLTAFMVCKSMITIIRTSCHHITVSVNV